MTKDQMLTKLRSDRDQAAARGDHCEALILNDRIRDLKEVAESNIVREKLGPAIIAELLELLSPILGSIDRQLSPQLTDERELDAPDDREYEVTITARQERDLTQAVCILERRLRDFIPPTATQGGNHDRGTKCLA
jgi:hypothetical protein